MNENIIPQVDLKSIQEKANEYAQKGAEDCLKEFYTGYNSPYKKAIQENLKNKTISDFPMGLPDIVGVLNEKIISEFDEIANTAMAQSLIPFAKKMLTRAEKVVNFSDVLKSFIESEYDEDHDPEDYTCEVSKSKHSWLNVYISSPDMNLELTLHTKNEKSDNPTFQFLSLPGESRKGFERKMVIKSDDLSIEIPITSGLLKNKFHAFVASLLIARSEIIMDVRDFDEDMFPSDHCHCD